MLSKQNKWSDRAAVAKMKKKKKRSDDVTGPGTQAQGKQDSKSIRCPRLMMRVNRESAFEVQTASARHEKREKKMVKASRCGHVVFNSFSFCPTVRAFAFASRVHLLRVKVSMKSATGTRGLRCLVVTNSGAGRATKGRGGEYEYSGRGY